MSKVTKDRVLCIQAREDSETPLMFLLLIKFIAEVDLKSGSIVTHTVARKIANHKRIVSANLQIETAYLKLTPKILGEAFVRGLMNLDWTINKIENNKIIAENRGAVVKVSFLDDLVVRLEMSPIKKPHRRAYKAALSKWLDNIQIFSLRELEYHYFIQQFDFDALP